MDAQDHTIQGGSLTAQNHTHFHHNNANAVNFVHVGDGSWGTSTSSWEPYGEKNVVDVKVDDETIEITYIQRALYSYTTINSSFTIGGPQQSYHNPDRVFKEVYGVKDGKLTLVKTIQGRVIPPQPNETYEFDE